MEGFWISQSKPHRIIAIIMLLTSEQANKLIKRKTMMTTTQTEGMKYSLGETMNIPVRSARKRLTTKRMINFSEGSEHSA